MLIGNRNTKYHAEGKAMDRELKPVHVAASQIGKLGEGGGNYI